METQLKRETPDSKVDVEALKSGGFIKQTQRDLFTIRLRCPAGKLTSLQLRKAAEIADKYGRGEVHTSVRQSIEIPYVHIRNFDDVVAELREVNWSTASCGPRVRVPTSCGGCTYNPSALVDTQSLCLEVDRRFFGTPTGHHKFKIAFSGCPTDCPRTRGMDLGFQGIVEPRLIEDQCDGCGLCVSSCDEKALALVDGLPVKDEDRCSYCGDCTKVCPASAMEAARRGWLARVGGKHGKHPIHSWEIAQFVSDEGCLALIEETLEWYRAQGRGRERIGATIVRLGLDEYIGKVVRPLGLEAIDTPEARRKFRAGGNVYL